METSYFRFFTSRHRMFALKVYRLNHDLNTLILIYSYISKRQTMCCDAIRRREETSLLSMTLWQLHIIHTSRILERVRCLERFWVLVYESFMSVYYVCWWWLTFYPTINYFIQNLLQKCWHKYGGDFVKITCNFDHWILPMQRAALRHANFAP